MHAGQLLAHLDTADLQAQLQSDLATANSNHANTEHTVYQGSLTIAQGVDSAAHRRGRGSAKPQQTLNNDQHNLDRDQNASDAGLRLAAIRRPAGDARSQRPASARHGQCDLVGGAIERTGKRLALRQRPAGRRPSSSRRRKKRSRSRRPIRCESRSPRRRSSRRSTAWSSTVTSTPASIPGNRQIFTLQQVDPVYAVLHGSSDAGRADRQRRAGDVVADDVDGSARCAGTVVGVLNQIIPGSTDFQVKVLLPNPGQRLRPGMVVQGTVDAAAGHAAFAFRRPPLPTIITTRS